MKQLPEAFPEHPLSPNDLLTVKEAAVLLRLSTRVVYAAIARGDLPALRVGRSIRIPVKQLSELSGLANGGK